MNLCNYISNNNKINSFIKSIEDKEIPIEIKTLGIKWNTLTDILIFKIEFSIDWEKSITKRTIRKYI